MTLDASVRDCRLVHVATVVGESGNLKAPGADEHVHLRAAVRPEVRVTVGDLAFDVRRTTARVVALRTQLTGAIAFHPWHGGLTGRRSWRVCHLDRTQVAKLMDVSSVRLTLV
ncbi:MAG: hypothetical protein ACYSVY_28870, partial [Planctomycetota bacterium]